MMQQPSQQSPVNFTPSIFEAIKHDDWEGMIATYAAAAYDAIHTPLDVSARAGRGSNSYSRQMGHQQPLPSSLMAALVDAGGPKRGGQSFCDEKMDDAHKSKSSTHPETLQELDSVIRDIIGAEIFDAYNAKKRQEPMSSKPVANSGARAQSATKKTRQHSPPSRKAPFNSLDQLLFHHQTKSNLDLAAQKKEDKALEKVMWNSACILSNSRPSLSFVITKEDKQLRDERAMRNTAPLKSMEEEDEKGDDHNGEERPPLFEGSVANSTPGDVMDGGSGAGTAQHLACLLDSPLALAILIALGARVEARHTAFRRLAIHEAACADSPLCLNLLMGVGTRFSLEVMQILSSSSLSTASTVTALHETRASFSSDDNNSTRLEGSTESKKQPKKLNIFSGWKKSSEPTNNQRRTQGKKGSGLIPFPLALSIIWEAIQHVRSGEISELEAAGIILDQVRVTRRTKVLLAMQCSPLAASTSENDNGQISPLSPSLSSLPGLGGVNQLFHPVQAIQTLAFHKCNVDGHGNTPLHWAAFKNSVSAMDVLLSHGVDINFPAQPSGWTPLHDAAYSDAGEAVARLLSAGATVDARSHSGATPLCFAAQEDSPDAVRMLLEAGADPSLRCLGRSPGTHTRANNADNNHFHSRFSGYTPLHYCAHYNAAKAARCLLFGSKSQHGHTTLDLLEIPDLNDKLPIHVAVARGSSEVLRELLHGGARVETASYHPSSSPTTRAAISRLLAPTSVPVAIPTTNDTDVENGALSSSPPAVITPVSSPVLRAMIPSQPITSSKPWNCLSQRSIDECKHLIQEAEMNWTPERHALFSPSDRNAILEVLRVGKRLEQSGQGIFLDLWPNILAFCGRRWFEVVDEEDTAGKDGDADALSMQCSSSDESSSDEDVEMTQFQLDGITIGR
eukprot:CAMPEP_0201721954 /NCGR_PEP_ID=MMETSP0593-20130828/6463_1 /ASSEMBLY_ACC=CAM_ASM_000672 /TAXON_ID=267983 /ORGANISM="Skeletonema japonicum, Strain CCMP2506" /LENGTH=905 /DNA_ID=CAMNT_0048212835 /DNA_START=267 /DNA_END=2984 /DNA_ORIENTATION=-